mgnify:CR=1 FL=1
MIRRFMVGFMAGRYGGDQLNLFLMVLYLTLYVIFLFTRLLVFEILALALITVSIFRSLSRNLERRRAENNRFMQTVRPVVRRWNTFCFRTQDREHRYFKCPNCGQKMRVPRGKGRITVHCRSCGAVFEEKS